MNIKPLGNRVHVAQDLAEEKTAGGLYIPDNQKEKPATGTVLATGEMCREVKPGDKIIYGKYAGTPIKDGDVETILMRETDILAITGEVPGE